MEKPTSLLQIIATPEQDYCLGKLLSLANELRAQGYRHKHIADAALSLGMDQSLEESTLYHLRYLRRMETLARDSIAALQNFVGRIVEPEEPMN